MSWYKKVIDMIEVMVFTTHNGVPSTESIILPDQDTSEVISVTNFATYQGT